MQLIHDYLHSPRKSLLITTNSLVTHVLCLLILIVVSWQYMRLLYLLHIIISAHSWLLSLCFPIIFVRGRERLQLVNLVFRTTSIMLPSTWHFLTSVSHGSSFQCFCTPISLPVFNFCTIDSSASLVHFRLVLCANSLQFCGKVIPVYFNYEEIPSIGNNTRKYITKSKQ